MIKRSELTEHEEQLLATCRAIEALMEDAIEPVAATQQLWKILSGKLLYKSAKPPQQSKPDITGADLKRMLQAPLLPEGM